MNVKNNKNKQTLVRSIIFIVLTILVLFSFYDYDTQLRNNTKNEMLLRTNEQNEVIKNAVEDRLSYVSETLESFALIASTYDTLNNPEFLTLLNENTKDYNYIRMAVTLPNGDSYTSDGMIHNSADRQYFLESMQGNTYVSDVLTSRVDNEDVIVVSVPIYKDNMVIGVLRTTIDILDLTSYLKLQTTSIEGIDAYLIQNDGVIITRDNHWGSVDYFTFLQENTKLLNSSLSDIKQGFAAQENLFYSYEQNDTTHYIYSSSIKNTHWIIITTLSSDIISQHLSNSYEILVPLEIKFLIIAICIILALSYYERKKNNEMHKMNQQLDAILTYTPGCILRFCPDNVLDIEFVNQELFRLSGYSEEEFFTDLNGDFRNLVYVDDLEYFLNALSPDFEVGKTYSLRYRIVCKDDRIVWLYEKRHYVNEKNKTWIYVTLMDITETQLMQEKLRISENRYQLILEQTESVVFEWDLQNDHIDFSDIWEKKYGFLCHYDNFLEVLNSFNPEASYISLLQKLICGEDGGNCETHLPTKNGDSIWCKIVARALKDRDGFLQTIIGSIENIDDIKKTTLMLEEKTRLDGLTQLLNKTTIEYIAQDILKNHSNQTHILFVLDVDDFKNINDTFGHISGDEALKAIAQALKTCFRSNDYIGRIGGDEFVVFMYDVKGDIQQMIQQKLHALQNNLKNLHYEQTDFCVTCSIGVAIYPKQGTTYADLFKNADKALYQVKKEGKDGFYFNGANK